MTPDIFRRRLLDRTVRAALLGGLLAKVPAAAWGADASDSSDSSDASDLSEPEDIAEDFAHEIWDVVVVGSGTAGLCAAIAAREAGARRVVILEKLALTGGHGILSSGSVAVATRRSQSEDPDADIREMTAEMLRAGGDLARPELVRKLARESESAVAWLAGMGVNWRNVRYRAVGSVTARNISTGSPQAGYDYVSALSRRAVAIGAEIRHNTRAVRLLTETMPDGSVQVVGVRAALGGVDDRGAPSMSDFPARAVVLATGGFGANVGMRMKYAPRLDATYGTTANPNRDLLDGAEGDGIRMAEAVGAELVGMEHIQLIPYSGGRLLDFVGGEIWVNDAGERFVPEGVPFAELARIVEDTGNRSFWAISDATTQKGASLGVKLDEAIVREAATIEEMAHGMDVPVGVLRRTIETWNRDVKRGYDTRFGFPVQGVPIAKPPFYYGRETWSVHFTCGGVAIDEEARVLTACRRPIFGLFAAGEVTGGVHGKDRLGGMSMTDTFVFGRTAGRSAAEWANATAKLREGTAAP